MTARQFHDFIIWHAGCGNSKTERHKAGKISDALIERQRNDSYEIEERTYPEVRV